VFAATQYGGIYFTHDNSSTVEGSGNGTDGSPLLSGMDYADMVRSACFLRKGDYLDSDECDNYAGIGYVIRYNFTAMHATPLYQTLADEAIVKEALNDKDFRIKITIHPLPQSFIEVAIGKGDDTFSAWFLVVLSFPFITGSFATFVVSERQSKAKHLQTVAGVQPAAYWLSTWL
jgi:hypothetical protein